MTAVAGIVVVVMSGTVLSFIATGSGLTLDNDSYYYLSAARIISAYLGLGLQSVLDPDLLREMVAHYADTARRWPPFYSALLSAVSMSADPYQAGRYLHLFFPVIIGTLLWLIFIRNNKSHTRAFLAIAVILLSPYILWLNWFVYSEIPFVIWQLSALLAVSWYLWTRRDVFLIMAIVFIALACLTRYIGVVMVPALVVTVWRVNRDLPLYRRTALSLSCVLFSILPVAVYLFSPLFPGQEIDIAGRSFAWNWTMPKVLFFTGNTLYSLLRYLAPLWWPKEIQMFFVFYAIAAIIIILIHQAGRQRRQPPAEAVVLLQGFLKSCLLGYAVMVLLLALFLDHVLGYTGITPRIMAPLFVWAVVLTALIGPADESAGTDGANRFAPVFSSIFIALLIMVYFIGSIINTFKNVDMVASMHRPWKNLTALEYIQKEKQTPWIVSNMPGEVFHYSGVPAFELPRHYDFIKDRINLNYLEQMARLRALLHQRHGMVLYFSPGFQAAPELVALQSTSLQECLDLLELEIYFRSEPCVILRPINKEL